MNTINDLIDTTLFHMDWVSSQQGYNFTSLKIAFTYALIDVEIDHEITPSMERVAYHRLIKAYLLTQKEWKGIRTPTQKSTPQPKNNRTHILFMNH